MKVIIDIPEESYMQLESGYIPVDILDYIVNAEPLSNSEFNHIDNIFNLILREKCKYKLNSTEYNLLDNILKLISNYLTTCEK